MADVKELLAYLLIEYPASFQENLSKTRVTKLIYLCDWKSCLEYGKQITNIDWVFDNFGPFVWDVMLTVEKNPELFTSEVSKTFYGNPKILLSVNDTNYKPTLSDLEKKVADFVIETTADLSFDQFVKLVYSTYPIMVSKQHTILDLPKLARAYKTSAIYKEIKPDLAFN